MYANIFAGHIVLMSIIGLMFLKSWLGSTLSFGFICTFYLRDIGCILTSLYTLLSALYFGAAVEEPHHEEALIN
jgi:F-type H+-transporting ATPase subunit a